MAYKLPHQRANSTMYKIIGGDQKEYGPTSADELRRWILDGRLSKDTLAQAENASNWKPLSAFPEFADALASQAGELPPSPAPSSFVTPLATGVPTGRELEIGECLAGGFQLLLSNFGLIFASCFLVWMIELVCQFLPAVGILYWLARGVLFGGLYLVVLRRIRGQPAGVGDVFSTFGTGFAQLMLVGVVTSLLTWIGLAFCIIPGVFLLVIWIFSIPLVADRKLEFWSAMELSRKAVMPQWFRVALLLLLALLPTVAASIYTETRITIAMVEVVRPLLESSSPDPSKFMAGLMQVMKQTLPLVLMSKVVWLLNMPFAVAVVMKAYESVFGTQTSETA